MKRIVIVGVTVGLAVGAGDGAAKKERKEKLEILGYYTTQ